ncbi:uncharacterized protein LOC127704133 isoform X2 [Mytilus californianus]|uniref:uncharacterized protein LOC127704133 isoform X2 n=1 Tax=Mytilus californianus TaxID=6549 RepID=UPI0022455ED0|nr:uncharacterized protein LOC127704133 isoform X2 [Mytilus californianus]
MFEKLLDDKRNTTVTLSFDEINQLGKESGYPVQDRREINQFLSYQNDVKNVIYHQDIPECVIISPNWLYSVIRQLLTAFHYEGENSDYKKKGLISLDLLNRIIEDTKRNTNQTKQDIISILIKFDIVAIAWRADEYKETATYCYYVPSVIPEEHTVDLVTLFESERRGKTSFLCFSFDFLPPSLINHVMVKLLSQYSICEQNGNIALYCRTLLANYDRYAKQKLYFLSHKNELLIQIWYYGTQQISPCFQGLRTIIESTVSNYKGRHNMNIAYTHILRCPDSKHSATDGWDIFDTSRKKTFYCVDHKTNYEDLYSTWFTDSNQTVEHSEAVNRNLESQFQRESRQRASVTVLGIPSIVLDSTTYTIQKGDTLRLRCQIESRKSMPVVKVIWWRKVKSNDVKVPVQNVMKYRGGTRTIPSLTILDVKDDDKGSYWCEAINSIGPSFSETVEVNVEAENPVLIDIHEEENFILAPNNGSDNQISRSSNKDNFYLIEENTEITDTKNVEIHQPFSEGKNAPSQRDIKKVLDAVILNAEKDQEVATEFRNHLKEFIPDIAVELLKEFVKPGVTHLQSTNELFKSARFVLILVTENFKLSMLDRYIGEKVLIESLNDSEKLFRVIPVSVDGPLNMPFELMPLIAIQFYHFQMAKKERRDDSIYIKTLKSLFLHGRENYLKES